MKQRAFAANQSLTVQGWDKLTLLHMMVASHHNGVPPSMPLTRHLLTINTFIIIIRKKLIV
ncbi:hypothetical protein DS963_25485 [Escherichia coli]|nr:hypothetical protein DS963_25485 [Escherichia coli]